MFNFKYYFSFYIILKRFDNIIILFNDEFNYQLLYNLYFDIYDFHLS
jgi:hypothetical protein